MLLSVGKAKGDPVPALVTNLDGLDPPLKPASVSAPSTAVKSAGAVRKKTPTPPNSPRGSRAGGGAGSARNGSGRASRRGTHGVSAGRCRPPLVAWVCCLLVPRSAGRAPEAPLERSARWGYEHKVSAFPGVPGLHRAATLGCGASGGRFMLIGWILCILGVCLNAMTLVVLTNREQLYAMDARAAVGTLRRGFSERSALVVRRVTAADEPAEASEHRIPGRPEESR